MNISLIGMSGVGKSFWSQKLVEKGFKRFCVDDLIEEKLEKELKKLGYSGINDVARWMGQPFDPQYSVTSKKYLDFEEEVMQHILTYLEQEANKENIVVDTTGSVIYLQNSLLKKLKFRTKVIYLETPQQIRQKMFEQYIQDPKPVIWGTVFQKKASETNEDALKRCYPELLSSRAREYEKLADKVLKYSDFYNPAFTVDSFIKELNSHNL